VARRCRVCDDSRREQIDAELLSGKSVPQISREISIPESNLYRHKQLHLGVDRFLDSAPIATMASIEALQARDLELAEIQKIALQRNHTQAFVAATTVRVRIILEIAALRGEVQPKLKAVMHVNLDHAAAERIARSYIQHKELLELSGDVIDAPKETKPQ
jgi:transposase-like protein